MWRLSMSFYTNKEDRRGDNKCHKRQLMGDTRVRAEYGGRKEDGNELSPCYRSMQTCGTRTASTNTSYT